MRFFFGFYQIMYSRPHFIENAEWQLHLCKRLCCHRSLNRSAELSALNQKRILYTQLADVFGSIFYLWGWTSCIYVRVAKCDERVSVNCISPVTTCRSL